MAIASAQITARRHSIAITCARRSFIGSFLLARRCLLRELRIQHRFTEVRLLHARRRLDERIRAAALQLRVLRMHAVLRAVIAELDVAGQRAENFERAPEFSLDRWRDHAGRTQAAAE